MEIEFLLMQFCDHATHFLGYSKATIKRYKHSLRYYCATANIKTIDEVSVDNLRTHFYIGRVDRNWSTNTFLTYHKSYSVFFDWCIKKGYLTTNPTKEIIRPKLEYKLPSKLTKQSSFRLLEIIFNYPYENKFIRYRDHAMFSTFIFAGLRKKELLNLRYSDVDLDNQVLFISQGKGSKDRIIPICSTLAFSLKCYLNERNKLKKTCPEFFASLQGNRGFSETGLKRLVERIRHETKLEFTLHKLRHTFATLMLEGGCDIYSLSKMMGHSDIKTTTIYLSASAEHLRSQIVKHPLNQ